MLYKNDNVMQRHMYVNLTTCKKKTRKNHYHDKLCPLSKTYSTELVSTC